MERGKFLHVWNNHREGEISFHGKAGYWLTKPLKSRSKKVLWEGLPHSRKGCRFHGLTERGKSLLEWGIIVEGTDIQLQPWISAKSGIWPWHWKVQEANASLSIIPGIPGPMRGQWSWACVWYYHTDQHHNLKNKHAMSFRFIAGICIFTLAKNEGLFLHYVRLLKFDF